MRTVVRAPGGGGPTRQGVEAEVERQTGSGYRVLAVAEADVPATARLEDAASGGLAFRGLLALADRVRPTAAGAIATLQAAGVDIIMITGDHPGTARAIADELGALGLRRVVTGPELDRWDDDELTARLPSVGVFARMSPTQKARVVDRLRHDGRVVGVTGDGANDAAAIRRADVGIALGTRATPAARESPTSS